MRPIQIITPSFADADTKSVADTQTLTEAGDLLLVSPTVTLDPPCYVTLTAVSDESAVSFIITGTGPSGQTQSETITGPNATSVSSTLTFATVTSINADGATTIEAGNDQAGYSAWMPLDIYAFNQVTSISVSVTGTIDYSIEYTNEDPFDNSFVQQAVAHPDATFTTCAVDHTASTTVLMRAVRYVVNSGDGTLRLTITQQSKG